MGLATLETPRTETLEPPPEFQLDSGRLLTTHPESDAPQPEQLSTQARAQVRLLPSRKERDHAVDTSLEPLQEWEGVVEWVEGDTFGARLTDITSPGEDEFTEFTLDEVSDHDLPLVVTGAVFYWTVARETSKFGQRRHVSMIRFRRLPSARAAQRVDVRREAEWIADELGISSNGADAAVA